MLGKYSPTVDFAYYKNQDWFEKYSNNNIYDPEGYDSYGYNKDGVDRAGNKELDYTQVCKCCGQTAPLYMDIVEQWSYDGIKPIKV
jgi:hypothetical protein